MSLKQQQADELVRDFKAVEDQVDKVRGDRGGGGRGQYQRVHWLAGWLA